MTHLDILPSELLIKIFKLATDNPVRDISSLVSWTRFEPARATNLNKKCKDAIRTKYTLCLVCSSFKKLSLELLYEDIWIRQGSGGLLEVLESSKQKDQLGLGSYVKRVSLSLAGDRESHQSLRSTYENVRRILLCCPNIRAISRPQEMSPEEEQSQDEILVGLPIDDLEFPFLHRVDWHNTPFDFPFASASSPRFIWTSRSLRVLVVGADNFPVQPDEQEPETVVDLPHVHTIGIRSFNAFGSERRRYSLSLPALRRLVIGRPEAIYSFFSGCLAPLSPQISALEIEPEPRFLRHDFVATLLGYCPNVTELYIPVATTRPMSRNEVARVIMDFAVRRVYLHAAFPGSAENYDYKELPWWTLLHEHFRGLCGPGSRLTVLERLILCGMEWKETIEDARFANLLRLVHTRGIHIECEDKQLQQVIANWTEELSEFGP